MAVKVGVLLSGCGVFDGSEIHEAVLTLLALDRAGADIVCTAPNDDQFHVLNHMTQQVMDEKRNMLIESARIAQGNIVDLHAFSADQSDALIIPGGFGAAKNLSTFALKGPQSEIHPQVQRILKEMWAAGKPIGALSIASATVVKALSAPSPRVTIGDDMGTASAIEMMGGRHHICSVDRIHVDETNKIVTTPTYMLGPGIKEVAAGIEKLVEKVLAMIAVR